MKFVALVAAMAFSATTVAAEELTPFASMEYQLEAEVIEFEGGVEFSDGAWAIVPSITATLDTDGNNFDLAGAEVTVAYTLSANATVYGRIEADGDFEYSEAAVGIAFTF